jgi:hypothetical protein
MTRPRFTPGERIPSPGTHCTGGWVGPRACLDTEVRRKILLPLPGIEPRSPGQWTTISKLKCSLYADVNHIVNNLNGVISFGHSSKIQSLVSSLLKGGNVVGRQTRSWSTEAKVWGIVPKHPVACMPSTRMGLYRWWLFNSPVLVGLIWTARNVRERRKWRKPSKRAL